MATQNFSLNPSNHPANNVVKFAGVPLINFTLHQNPSAVVQGSSIRLNGRLICKSSTGADINGTATLADERLGVYNLFDRLSISLLSNSQIVEEIKFYNKFLSSLIPVTQSEANILGVSNSMSNACISQGCAGDVVSKNNDDDDADYTEQYFSITLPCGLFNSQVPLIHGLIVSLSLVPDAQAFLSEADTPTYELTDLHLTGIMTSGVKPPTQFMYNSITSYYSVINSAFATLNYNLGLSNAIGAWVTFVPSENTNNYTKNGTRNLPLMKDANTPATINDLQFLMNGVKVGLQYPITDDHSGDQTLFNSQIMKNFISAIKNFTDLSKTNVSAINTALTQSYADINDKVKGDFITGVGLKLDYYSNQGMNTIGGNFTIQFSSDLDQDYANSAYMFVQSRNMVTFNDVGIQVLN